MDIDNSVYYGLVILLSELSVLKQKTLSYHWNVVGEDFYQRHLLFERIYNSLDAFVDRVAEQSRAYGKAPGTFNIYLKMSSIKEDETLPESGQMVVNLISDLNKLKQTVTTVNDTSEGIKDIGVVNILGDIAECINTSLYLLSSITK